MTRPRSERLAILRANLMLITKIHEHWHFEEGLTEEQFDAFLHRHINETRKAIKVLLFGAQPLAAPSVEPKP